MAAAWVQHTGNVVNGTASSSIAVPVTNAPTVGNLLVLNCNLDSTSTDITSVTDDAGNTWQQDRALGASGHEEPLVWSAAVTAVPTSVTVNLSANSSQKVMSIDEFSGMDTSAGRVIATDAAGQSGTGTSVSRTSGTASADGMAVGLIAYKGGASTAPTFNDSSFTSASEVKKGSGQHDATHTSFANVASGATATLSGTFTAAPASPGWVAAVLIYKAAGGASPATIILGEATSTPTAFGPTVVAGPHTTVLGIAQSTPSAFGLTLAPGARTLTLGEAVSTAAAFGVDLRSVITVHLGIASSSPLAFGPTILPGAKTVLLGEATSSPTAFGPTLVPGPRTLALGEAVSTAQALGIDVRSVTVLQLGKASSTPQALGADLRPSGVSLVLGVAQSTPVARGVSLVPGAKALVLGKSSSVAQAFGLTLSQLIPASPYPDPRNQIAVVVSINQTSPQIPVINQVQVVSSVNDVALVSSGINTVIAIQEA